MSMILPFVENPTVLEIVGYGFNAGLSNPGVVTLSRAPKLGELVILIAANNNSITASTPSGFTLQQQIGSGIYNTYIWYKIAGASEPSSYSISFNNSSDERDCFGIIISTYNVGSIFGTNRSQIVTSPATTPTNILASTVSINNGSLVIFLTKLLGNQRDANSFSQNFLLGFALPSSNAKAYVAYKSFVVDDASVNPSWSWTGGTTGFLVNWIVLNPT